MVSQCLATRNNILKTKHSWNDNGDMSDCSQARVGWDIIMLVAFFQRYSIVVSKDKL